MLRLSTSRDRTLSSYSGPPDPPLASVLEQCYWGENNEDYFYINKHNDRRLQETPRSTRFPEKRSSRHHRPSTAPVPHFSGSSINITGEKKPYISKYDFDETSDLASNDSRCSTPEFMKEIYEAYSQLSNQNSLLRRPVSFPLPDLNMDSSNNSENESVQQPDRAEENVPLAQTDASTDTDDIAPSKPGYEAARKTVKVAIDIPLCQQNDVSENENDDNIDKRSKPTTIKNNVDSTDFILAKIKDEFKSPKEFLSFSKPKTPGKTKRRVRSAKKKSGPKNKLLVTTVTVDYSQGDDTEKNSNPKENETPQKNSSRHDNPSWKRKHEDVVTQMSRLDLHGLDQAQKSIPRQKRCSSASLPRPKAPCPHEKKLSKPAVDIDRNTINCRSRKIPIQIISDPFKCTGVRANSSKGTAKQRLQRPFSASPYVPTHIHR